MIAQGVKDWLNWYLLNKAFWSKANDALMWWASRKKLPVHEGVMNVWWYIAAHGNPYTGDPLMGVGDFYLHPERLQASLENATKNFIDCDEIAGYAHVATRSIPGAKSRVVTLLDAALTGSHVICVGDYNGSKWAIDNNGFRWLLTDTPEFLCNTWSTIYPDTKFILAVDSPYPF